MVEIEVLRGSPPFPAPADYPHGLKLVLRVAMSALPPKADIKMGAALRLLMTQSGHRLH